MTDEADKNTLLTEDRGGVRIITINRPEARNALNQALTQRLLDEMSSAATDASVRAVVITGADGYFCVGGDVKGMNARADSSADTPESIEKSLRIRMEASRLLHEMPKPTISAVEGAAAGAGLSLALACDFRVTSRDAKITVAFAKVGLSGDYGGTYYISKLLGSAKLRELYLLCPLLKGQEATDIGLFNRATAPGDALKVALEMAEGLANGPTLALGRMKQNMLVVEHGGSLSDLLDSEARNHGLSTKTEDHKEAAAAFVAKRPPAFKGR